MSTNKTNNQTAEFLENSEDSHPTTALINDINTITKSVLPITENSQDIVEQGTAGQVDDSLIRNEESEGTESSLPIEINDPETALEDLRRDLWFYLTENMTGLLGDSGIRRTIYAGINNNLIYDVFGEQSHNTKRSLHPFRESEEYSNNYKNTNAMLYGDAILTDFLGGRRSASCNLQILDAQQYRNNDDGTCTSQGTGFGETTFASDWTFTEEQKEGKDKFFLGGHLNDQSPFGKHYQELVNNKLNGETIANQLRLEIRSLKEENTIMVKKIEQLEADHKDIRETNSQIVFPYVNWDKVNRSKAWYKDVDWSLIPFNNLSKDEKGRLDWSKINYAEANNNDSFDSTLIDWSDISGAKKAHQIRFYRTIDWASIDFTALDEDATQNIDWAKVNYAKAQASGKFDIFSLDWNFLNQLGTQTKKIIYRKIAWNKVDFTSGDSSTFDWSTINIKKAMASQTFTLDAVDIEETKKTKNFKQLSAALKKTSGDGLLAGTSDETLKAIGYENFAGKIGDTLIKNFTTTSHDYSIILKPLSYTRASAVATAMGGSLAQEVTDHSHRDELIHGIQSILSGKQVAVKMLNSQVDDKILAWFMSKSGEENQQIHSTLDLQSFEQYSGNIEKPLTGDSKLWFVVEKDTSVDSSVDQNILIDSNQTDLAPTIDI